MSTRAESIGAADPAGSADWGLDGFDLGADALLLVGFSLNVLERVDGALPPGSVLVIEEPDIIEKRRVTELAARFPAVGDVIAWPYLELTALHRLLAGEPRLGSSRAVVPGVEYAVGPASVLASALRRPGAGLRAGMALRDKYELRLLAGSAGVANPEFALVSEPAEVEAFMHRVGRPCVLKPTARQASFGVHRLGSPSDVAGAWDYATGADEGDAAPERGIPSRMIVETAVAGREFSVEMLLADGDPVFANVTAKDVLPGPFPVEVGHTVPASGPGVPAAALAEATQRLGRAAGFGWGVLHSEWIAGPDGCYLIECAGRLPGGEIPGLISLAWGFGFVEAYLACLLGGRPNCPTVPIGGAAVRFLPVLPGEAGMVTGVRGGDQAAAAPGVVEVHLSAEAGKPLAPTTSSWRRAGYVVATGRTAEDARRAAQRGAGAILIETEPWSEIEPPSETEPRSKTEPEPRSKTEPEPWSETEPEPRSKTEPEPRTKTDLEPWSETEPEPRTKTEPEPRSKTETEPRTKTEPEPRSETEPEPRTKTEPEPRSETEPEPWSETEPEPRTKTETETEPRSKTETEPRNKTDPEPWSETEPEPRTKTEPEPWSETEPEPRSKTETETEPRSKTEPEPRNKTETEPEAADYAS